MQFSAIKQTIYISSVQQQYNLHSILDTGLTLQCQSRSKLHTTTIQQFDMLASSM